MTETATQEQVATVAQRLQDEVSKVIVGKEQCVQLALIGLLAQGHLLVEDIPGVGKTTLAKAIALACGGDFKRIQFTPDLLPADVTGVTVYNQRNGTFEFTPGPVFANILLADEINRATPKTQSSLLECMEEAQVTTDGTTYPVPHPFLVIATENPVEYRGTYPLPEAQLDRFLMRLTIGYPSRAQEMSVLSQQIVEHPLARVQQVVSVEELVELQHLVHHVHVSDAVKQYIVDLTGATRDHDDVLLGASPRGSLALMRSGQALAAMNGRSFVTPDDIKQLAGPTLSHRLVLRPELRTRQYSTNRIVEEIVATVEVPVVNS